VVVGLGSRRGT